MRGIEGCIPLIHGSQGCSTYIRRYGISHFREPIDIASSNFVEATAIFGGRENLFTALDNVSRSYKPAAIGITSTCLSETIGENVPMYLKQYEAERAKGLRNNDGQNPLIFYASTPSYRGTHMDGFHEAVYAAVSTLVNLRNTAEESPEPDLPAGASAANGKHGRVNLISGFVSAEDLRELHSILKSFTDGSSALNAYTLLPDYSESLDGGTWETYQKLPEGGTAPKAISLMGEAAGTIYLGHPPGKNDAGKWLKDNCAVPLSRVDLPIGIENSDAFFASLSEIAGQEIPGKWAKQRQRLIDAYIDGHKYVNGKRAVIYGEEDFVIALASFLDEIGVIPVIAATGAENTASGGKRKNVAGSSNAGSMGGAGFRERIKNSLRNTRQEVTIMDDADFVTMLEKARDLEPDFIMGHSKGLYLSRELNIPLVRCGFPVHDRIGGQRILHLGYRGTLNLFDLVCNALMEAKQNQFTKGYTYI
jgi:nitrogenase molybdenum-iron protein NifN